MDKGAKVPAGFPVGRLRLTRMLAARKSMGATRTLPPLMARAGGGAPARWKPGQTQDQERRSIQARLEGGTLAEWAASRKAPASVPRPTQDPHIPDGVPPFANVHVSEGTGTVRDANVQKAAGAVELLKQALGPTSFGGAIARRDVALGKRRQPDRPRISRATGAATFRAQLPKKTEGAKLASDPMSAALLGSIGAMAGFATSAALQKGMNTVREMIWKHMTPMDKAKLLLRRAKKLVIG